MLVVQHERGADSFPPPPSSFPLPLTQSSVWSVTQHAALPQPNGAIIKNDRNLFLATKQAEATDVSSQKKELFTPRPPELQENLLCQNWDCLKLTGCEKEFWSWVGKGRRDVQWNGRKFQGFFFSLPPSRPQLFPRSHLNGQALYRAGPNTLCPWPLSSGRALWIPYPLQLA